MGLSTSGLILVDPVRKLEFSNSVLGIENILYPAFYCKLLAYSLAYGQIKGMSRKLKDGREKVVTYRIDPLSKNIVSCSKL